VSELHRFDDRESMAQAAAGRIAGIMRQGGEGHELNVALAGGSSPARTYEILSGMPDLPWDHIHFFFSDERLVPLDDSASNYHMAEKALFERTRVPRGNLYPVAVETSDARKAASAYERSIREHLGAPVPQVPRFNLILLGMGADGHTASLFPGSKDLDEAKRLVIPVDGKAGSPPVDRVSFTLPLINAAGAVLFLVAGRDKLPVVDAIIKGQGKGYPASRVRPDAGPVWFTAP